MLTVISTIAVILVGLLWYSFSIGANSHIRARAEEHPDSWMYLYITLFDQVLKATIFRPVRAAPTPVPPTNVSADVSLNDLTEVIADPEGIMTAEYAISIRIDPKPKVPKHVWRFVRLETMMIVSGVVALVVVVLLKVAFTQFLTEEAALIASMSAILALFILLLVLMAMEWGPFNVSMKLHMNPFVVVIATRRTIFFHSSWLPRTLMQNQGVSFAASDGQFMSNIFLIRENEAPIIVFSYPTYFRSYLPLDGGLPALVERLNRLILLSRQAPNLELSHPLFGH